MHKHIPKHLDTILFTRSDNLELSAPVGRFPAKKYYDETDAGWNNEKTFSSAALLYNGAVTGSILCSQLPRVLFAKGTEHSNLLKNMNEMKFRSPPDLQKTFQKMGIELSTQTELPDYYYNLLRPTTTQRLQLIGSLAYKRALIERMTQSELLNTDLIKEINADFNVYKLHKASGSTALQIYNVLNVEYMHSLNCEFDIGMTPELLDMFNFSNPEHERFREEHFHARCSARNFLNTIKRFSAQMQMDAFSLSHYFVTKINNWGTTDWEMEVDKKTNTTSTSMIPARTIWAFQQMFENSLSLHNHDETYKKYLIFLKEHLGINYVSLASSTWLFQNQKNDEFSQIFFSEIPSFIQRFYGQDSTFFNLFQHQENIQPMKELILDIDIITYCLWKCSRELPFMDPIAATLPPNLNPMSQIWIWSNIVSESIVNNSFKKLLAMGTTEIAWKKIPKGDEHEIVFSPPLFKTLSGNVFDEIDILITTKFGNPVPFVGGPLTIVLQFERIL